MKFKTILLKIYVHVIVFTRFNWINTGNWIIWNKNVRQNFKHFFLYQENDEPMNELVASLMNVNNPLDQKMGTSQMTLFSNTAPITEADIE